MSEAESLAEARWAQAALAAAVFAVDPPGLGGVVLRVRPGPVRERWLAMLPSLLPAARRMRRIPLHVTDGRLLGGLDLAATLAAGRPVAERGLLADADGGIVLLAMAERVAPGIAGKLAVALDTHEVALEREGFTARLPARFGLVALDEGESDEERPPPVLTERLALHLDLEGLRAADCFDPMTAAEDVSRAAALLPRVVVDEDVLTSLCAAGLALGVASLRATAFAVRAARAVAALHARDRVATEDAAAAARLVLAPRATRLPVQEAEDDTAGEPPPPTEGEAGGDDQTQRDPDGPLDDVVLAAAAAAIPAGLLAQLAAASSARARAQAGGRGGATQRAKLRGRPAGIRPGEPRHGARLSVVETLRAAAPWQPVRRRERARDEAPEPGRSGRAIATSRNPPREASSPPKHAGTRIEVRRDDFRVRRYKQRAQATTVFVVDASGSSALHRLAEAKGAVELLLAECYVRRDQVALIAFRGAGAELLLPPTRSLVRAKRSLAALPGGGGTPLAAGIECARLLCESLQRRGGVPGVVFLTDGRANVARDGSHGRPQAEADASAAARALRAAGVRALLVDTSPRPQPLAEKLAGEMGGVYLALPHADARALSRGVAAAFPGAGRGGTP